MTLEEKIKIIEEKIANLPQEFDVEENHIILNNPRLIELIVDTIFKNLHLCNEEVFGCFNDTIINALLERDSNTIYYNFIENMFEITIPSSEELDSFLTQAGLSPEQEAYFKDKVKEAFLNKELPIERYSQSESAIREMIKYGRFDLISQIQKVYLEEEFLEEIWQVYPFDEYPMPKFFTTTSGLCKNHIQDFPIQEALLLYFRLIIDCTYGDRDSKNVNRKILPNVVSIIKEKLKDIESLDFTFIRAEYEFFNDMCPKHHTAEEIGEETVKSMFEIATKLFRIGLYEVMDDVLDANLVTDAEVRNIIIDIAKSGNHKTMADIRFFSVSHKFNGDIELATILIENGFIQEARTLNYDLHDQKIPYIIEQLNNKNEKFKTFAEELVYEGKGYHEKQFDLYLAMLNSGFVSRISTGTFSRFDESEIENLKYILIKYPNIFFNADSMYSENFLQILPTLNETKRIDTIVFYLKKSYYPDNIEIFVEVNKNGIISNLIKNDFTKGLELLNDKTKTIIEIPELLDEYCKNDVYINRLLDKVNHDEELTSFYNVENYNRVKNYLCRTYNIPLENLEQLQSLLGPLIIRYIENENIQALVKLPQEERDKILALFPKEEYTMQDLRGIYDSLKQYEYSKKHASQVQIFPRLLHAIEDKNDELIEELIVEISKELDQTFVKRFLKKYDLPTEYTKGPLVNLVRLVVEKIKISTGEKLDKYQTILHEMTDYYISKKREAYRNTYNMESELNLPYELEEKSFDRALIKYIITVSPHTITRITKPSSKSQTNQESSSEPWSWDWDWEEPTHYTLFEYIVTQLEEQGIEKELAKETINYYINKDQNECRDFKLVQKTIPKLINVVKTIIDSISLSFRTNKFGIYTSDIEEYIKQADANGEIKRIYQIKEEHNLFDILTQLNIPVLQKGVLSNPEVYESLLTTMQKRKLHLIPKSISNILGTEHMNISGDLSNIAGFMSYYGSIHDSVKSNLEANGKPSNNILLNITNILIYAEVYSGISSVYSQILGSEDAKLIKANPGPNAASRKLANDERLKEAVERTKKLFERQEITIPPFEETIDLSSDKKMHVVVGNFTDPSNLTHGERTGACMRIGGVGETLFQFALDNPNGFHIRFEDPKTHEYISRVTGFRNGNTVFLNELRDSCNKDKYNNNDVIEACKKSGEMLIELSKNSPCPIENVVVHRAYATSEMDAPLEDLGVQNIKEGLPTFYTDVGRSAIILATSATKGKFAPVNLDKSKVPTYQPLREKARVTKNIQEASNKINRVNSVKRLLAGENYEYIEPMQFSNGIIYAIVSHDWYIYVDEKGNILSDCMDIDPRAKEEFAEALIEVQNNISKISEENMEVKHGL